MENEERWNTFARTGSVRDYLAYAGMRDGERTYTDNSAKNTESSEGEANREMQKKEL